MEILGIDVGGSGIKGAVVETKNGKLISERIRIETPQPATPELVSETIATLVKQLKYKGSIGVGFPAAIIQGVVKTASNIDKSWIGVNANKLFSKSTKCHVFTLNDADAAGIAEDKYGGGKNIEGVVIIITIGTGVGTAFFSNGRLVPNTEVGHIVMPNGLKAEHYVSDFVRQRDDLSWDVWTSRMNEYLEYLENLFYPDLIIVGGGISKKSDKFLEGIKTRSKVIPAKLLNNAGIIGAAEYARKSDK